MQQRIDDVLFDGVTRTEFKVLCSIVDRLVANGDRAAPDLERFWQSRRRGLMPA